MKLLIIGLLLMINGHAQDEKLTRFSSIPNDWFSNFEFRGLIVNKPEKVSKVLVVLTEELKNIEDNVLNPKWKILHERGGLGIVCLGYRFKQRLPKGSDNNPNPAYIKDREHAMDLLKKQLDSQVRDQYPNVSEYGYVANGGAFEVVQHLLAVDPKKTAFWITEDSRWFIPKDFKSRAEGLSISRDPKGLHRMLEAQIENSKNDRNVLFVRDAGKDRTAVDRFIVEFIKSAISDDRKRPLIVDLITESEIRANSGSSPNSYTTRLMDPSILESWRELNTLDRSNCLPEVVEERVETGIPAQPELTLYLRLPATAGSSKSINGVVCIVTYTHNERLLKDNILHRKVRGDLINWAEAHQMAVVTWNTATLWKSGTSQEDLEKDAARNFDKRFDQIAAAWNKAMRMLANKYDLPQTGYYFYGVSRGAHWGHRLALREPQRFLAVHFHVANSYDIPNEKAKNVLWLVTTGELDAGYHPAIKFYQKCNNLGYPLLFKAGANLGHTESPEILRLGLEFFEYSAKLKKRMCPGREPTPEHTAKIATSMRSDIQNASFFGDFINQGVYANGQGDWIPIEQRIPLVSQGIAESWGKLAED